MRDSSVGRGLRLPTMRVKNAKSNEPYWVSRVAGGLRYREAAGPPPRSDKQLLHGVVGA